MNTKFAVILVLILIVLAGLYYAAPQKASAPATNTGSTQATAPATNTGATVFSVETTARKVAIYVQGNASTLSVNFGDGVTGAAWDTGFENASNLYMEHTYGRAGTYTLILLESGKEIGRQTVTVK